MKEATQDETVEGTNDEVDLIFFLGVSLLTDWLNIAEWIALTILGIYFAINFIWFDKNLNMKKKEWS